MSKPIVAIVGRPNVGKSTLFNRIVGQRIAVVAETPGVTRDRLYRDVQWEGKRFLLVDTGGFQAETEEDIVKEIKRQALIAIEEADIVLMLMDAQSGLTPMDTELNNALRRHSKKIVYAVNKIDGPKKEAALSEFYALGVDLFPVSAVSAYGFDELMESMTKDIPLSEETETEYPKIAIVGRPNAGKSTLVNSLLGKERMIVSPVAGTTRDAVDSICTYYKKKYILIDTAGIRKKGKMAKTIERFSFLRTVENLQRCDVAVIVLDASEGIVELDQKIANLIYEANKGAIILFNKWDVVEKNTETLKALESSIRHKLWFMHYAPVMAISALSRQRVTKVFPMIDEVIAQNSKRITTHELNNFLKESLSMQTPPLYKGKEVKLYYITQVDIKPPTFVIFANRPDGIKETYLKFLEKQLRERFSFNGTPVRFFVKERRKGSLHKKQ